MKNILLLFVLIAFGSGCSSSVEVSSEKKVASVNFNNSFDARINKNASK